MLEKDFGIPKIHRLWIIHLYEADLNLLMGIYFARVLVRHIESNNGFNDGCYGNRAGCSAHEPVLVEELQNTICYLSRTNRLDQDNDATSCYDRKFPRQPRPDKESWAQWRRALRFLVTSPRCTQLHLLVPLGSMYPIRSDSPKWYFYRSFDLLVVRSRFTDAIIEYPPEQCGRRAQTFLKHHGTRLPSIPTNSVPISPPSEDRRQWSSRPDAGGNAIPALVPSPPPQSFKDYVSRLDPALRALVLDVEIFHPMDEIIQLLSSTTTLTLVGDGGAKTCRGSYSAIAALDSI
jgi:hypothetical protein